MKNFILCLFPLIVNTMLKGSGEINNCVDEKSKNESVTKENINSVKSSFKNEDKFIQVIVNCSQDTTYEKELVKIGKLKYRLPMINSYVIEIPQKYVSRLKGLKGVNKVEQDAHLTAQMHMTREVVNDVWTRGRDSEGKNIGIAILDTGIYPHKDLVAKKNRITGFKDFVNNINYPYDDNGHGTHVAGILAGDGTESNGKYIGIAPECDVIGVKVLNEKGAGNISDVLAGIQWTLDNKRRYNIKILNLSVGMQDIEGEESALVKGVDAAWNSGLIVVVAAGNNGPEKHTITTPGISRKIITVGSSDDAETVKILSDPISDYSGRGPTKACIKKPDVVAPGSNIISCNADMKYQPENKFYPDKNLGYIKKSGTSMATPMITGSIVLLLSKNPDMTNKEIKLKIKESTRDLGFEQSHQGWGLIDIKKLLD